MILSKQILTKGNDGCYYLGNGRKAKSAFMSANAIRALTGGAPNKVVLKFYNKATKTSKPITIHRGLGGKSEVAYALSNKNKGKFQAKMGRRLFDLVAQECKAKNRWDDERQIVSLNVRAQPVK
jgi:hypothetical protein